MGCSATTLTKTFVGVREGANIPGFVHDILDIATAVSPSMTHGDGEIERSNFYDALQLVPTAAVTTEPENRPLVCAAHLATPSRNDKSKKPIRKDMLAAAYKHT